MIITLIPRQPELNVLTLRPRPTECDCCGDSPSPCSSCGRSVQCQYSIDLPDGGRREYCADCLAECAQCERRLPINGSQADRLWPFRLWRASSKAEQELLICGDCWAHDPDLDDGVARPIPADCPLPDAELRRRRGRPGEPGVRGENLMTTTTIPNDKCAFCGKTLEWGPEVVSLVKSETLRGSRIIARYCNVLCYDARDLYASAYGPADGMVS